MLVPHKTTTLVRLVLAVAFSILVTFAATFTHQAYTQDDVQPAQSFRPGTQPLEFSHRIHAGDYKIQCQYCHPYVRRGPVAGIPSVKLCMGCHNTIAIEQPEILKLANYWKQLDPIPWVRVHNLPNYVRFTHRRHVEANINCQTCHGEVNKMESAVQVAPLTMNWCVTCHEERAASKDCLLCHY